MLDVCSVVDVDLGGSELEVADNLVACVNFDNGRKGNRVGNIKICMEKDIANESIDTSVRSSKIEHVGRGGENSVEMGDLHATVQEKDLGGKGKGKKEEVLLLTLPLEASTLGK
jgi:hypothetical protein